MFGFGVREAVENDMAKIKEENGEWGLVARPAPPPVNPNSKSGVTIKYDTSSPEKKNLRTAADIIESLLSQVETLKEDKKTLKNNLITVGEYYQKEATKVKEFEEKLEKMRNIILTDANDTSKLNSLCTIFNIR